VSSATTRASRLQLGLAFACIYVIWGSTYLGIRFAIETLPPLLMAGIRFLIAGSILYGWLLLRGEARRASGEQWRAAALLGTLFFLGGNGGVSWAEQRVPSGLAALLVATIPFWMVMIDWARGGEKPTARVATGILAGFAGVGLLVGGRGPGAGVDPIGFLVVTVGEICWAYGSVISRRLPHPGSHLQSGAMQMLAGGAALCVAGILTGEGARFHPTAVSTRSLLAVAYLVFAGSIVAFSAYNWLLQATTPARVGTYAFVNPAVAVFLGWALAGEPVGPYTLVAGAFILTGVVLIVFARGRSEGGDGTRKGRIVESAPEESAIRVAARENVETTCLVRSPELRSASRSALPLSETRPSK
jgi:drug/metabolite transporter (DMT)-like permease